MNHLHFNILNSTHLYLKENIDELIKSDRHILVSCDQQTAGIGRTGNTWLHNENSIAMSFTLKPCTELSLTTIEIGIIVSEFFKNKFRFDTKLKWPNDLYTLDKKKIGGIITNYYRPDVLIIGLGINLGPITISDQDLKNKISSLILNEKIEIKSLVHELYNYIESNRISQEDILLKFNQMCIHQNQNVQIDNLCGVFIGIDKSGNALIKTDEKITPVSSGHLLMN